MNKENIRTRFAPSPTGYLHIGGVRTALFCWLLARKYDGKFVVRIEDTDQKRKVDGAIEHIFDSLSWLGIEPDESINGGGEFGPYLQSNRLEIYQKYAKELLEQGFVYPDPYSKEELDSLRKEAKANNNLFRYRNYRPEKPPEYDGSQPLRFRIPDQTKLTWDDAIRGNISFRSHDLDDFIILKSDGFPTYNFANVIDDHLMQISHVLRGEEFVSSTPLHMLLYEAFDWEQPIFAHLPQVLAKDGKKLSKRHGAASVTDYRNDGYIPEALVNFLALLGWNDGTEQEIYSKNELFQAFSLEAINPSPAVFDTTKLNWINSEYLKNMSFNDRFKQAHDYWPTEANEFDESYRKSVFKLIDERMQYFGELPELTTFFFSNPNVSLEDLATKKTSKKDSEELIEATIVTLNEIDTFERDAIESKLRELVETKNTKAGTLFPLIRLAVTGTRSSPPLFDTLHVIGKETVLERLKTIIKS